MLETMEKNLERIAPAYLTMQAYRNIFKPNFCFDFSYCKVVIEIMAL